VSWYWILAGAIPGAIVLVLYAYHRSAIRRYVGVVARIFTEKPLFIIPRGQPPIDAEDVILAARDGSDLHGCYLKARGPRRGVILFGLEFGSNRWACVPYTEFLRDAGYDIFAVETRGQGESPAPPGYEPLQWVTTIELDDYRAAIAYLKTRPDADKRGVGLFGLSKGGSAGLFLAAEDPYVRCFVTDGIFAILTTMVPYMRQWVSIYTPRKWLVRFVPDWYYGILGRRAVAAVEKERRCRYPNLERAMTRLGSRPLLMIHGGADNYIKPEMAKTLYDLVRGPKDFWLVDKAKHNQAIHQANGEYRRRVLEFFDKYLGRPVTTKMPQPELVGAS
jgi:pimeloyl-ACP methyl ester carboxylesterase